MAWYGWIMVISIMVLLTGAAFIAGMALQAGNLKDAVSRLLEFGPTALSILILIEFVAVIAFLTSLLLYVFF